MIGVVNIIYVATDWWGIGAIIFSGIITAVATMGAVIYTNHRTKNSLWNKRKNIEKNRKNNLNYKNMSL